MRTNIGCRRLTCITSPKQNYVWLTKATPDDLDLGGDVLFSRHQFTLLRSFGDDECMNYDFVLSSYKVQGNDLYDRSADPDSQQFNFSYEGQKKGEDKTCNRRWQANEVTELGGDHFPPYAPDGRIGFPTDLIKSLKFGLLTQQSLLGTSRSEETGASLYIGVGLPGNPFSKSDTGGFKGGVNFSKSDGTSTVIDITGSGIPAIVYRDGDRLSYCAGIRDNTPAHAISYPSDRCGTIEGISDFSFSSSSSSSAGVEGYAGDAFGGVSYSQSENQTFTYFSDVDGDGLVDIVDHGQVFYNRGEACEGGTRDTCAGGKWVVRFEPNSALRPPIPGHVTADVATTRVPQDLRNTITKIETRLAGISRRLRELDFSQTTIAWQAPLDGAVSIAGTFERGVSNVDPTDKDAGPWRLYSVTI